MKHVLSNPAMNHNEKLKRKLEKSILVFYFII